MSFSWKTRDYLGISSSIFLVTVIYFLYSDLSIILSFFILATPSFFILKYLNKNNDFELFKVSVALFLILVATIIFKVLASIALALYASTVISFIIIQHWVYILILSFLYNDKLIYFENSSKFYWYLISILGIVLIACQNLDFETFLKLYHTNFNIFFNWHDFVKNPDLKILEANTTTFTENSLKSVMKGLTSKLFFFFFFIDILVPLIRNKLDEYILDL